MHRPKTLRRIGNRVGRALHTRPVRELRGGLLHLRYALLGKLPDPCVPDDVVADRVRSALGPLEKLLDVPHVNVTVCGGIAMLHGAVTSKQDDEALASAAFDVPGVLGVESHLHVGLDRCETRPSTGRAQHIVDEVTRSLVSD